MQKGFKQQVGVGGTCYISNVFQLMPMMLQLLMFCKLQTNQTAAILLFPLVLRIVAQQRKTIEIAYATPPDAFMLILKYRSFLVLLNSNFWKQKDITLSNFN